MMLFVMIPASANVLIFTIYVNFVTNFINEISIDAVITSEHEIIKRYEL